MSVFYSSRLWVFQFATSRACVGRKVVEAEVDLEEAEVDLEEAELAPAEEEVDAVVVVAAEEEVDAVAGAESTRGTPPACRNGNSGGPS